jgi:hypothetical protein
VAEERLGCTVVVEMEEETPIRKPARKSRGTSKKMSRMPAEDKAASQASGKRGVHTLRGSVRAGLGIVSGAATEGANMCIRARLEVAAARTIELVAERLTT